MTQRNRHAVLVDQAELAAEVQAQRAEHARDDRRLVGGEEHGRARDPPGSASSSASERNFAIGERTSPSLVDDEVGEPFRAPLLRDLLEPCELAARERLRRDEEAHGRRVREDAELASRA